MRLDRPLNFDKTCKRRVVLAILETADKQRVYLGSNWCETPVLEGQCPRKELPSGVGYHYCLDTCHQPGHAEIDVLRQAGREDAVGSTIYVINHNYICESCQHAMRTSGVKEWKILS